MKGGSSLFDRALITGLTVVYIVIQLYGLGWIKTNALNKLAIQNSKCQWKRRLFVCPDLDHWQQKFLMAGEKNRIFTDILKTILNVLFVSSGLLIVYLIIKNWPPNYWSFNEMFVTGTEFL